MRQPGSRRQCAVATGKVSVDPQGLTILILDVTLYIPAAPCYFYAHANRRKLEHFHYYIRE